MPALRLGGPRSLVLLGERGWVTTDQQMRPQQVHVRQLLDDLRHFARVTVLVAPCRSDGLEERTDRLLIFLVG